MLLFKTIQQAASPRLWSKGVEICRAGGVEGERWSLDEILLRVKVPGRPISPTVTFWPQEEDWNCNCGGEEDPCEHVVAAAIALKKAQEQGEKLPEAKNKSASITYHFFRKDGFLHFHRYLVDEGREELFPLALTAIMSGRIKGPRLSPSKEDMTADHLLDGQRQGGLLRQQTLAALIACLQACERVYLDKRKIHCCAEASGPSVCIEDWGGGVRLYSKWDPGIQEVFKNGAALCGESLHPLQTQNFPPPLLKMLAEGEYFGAKEIPRLVGEILPLLKGKIKLEVLSKKLPASVRLPPRILWESEAYGEQLKLTPLIVYGEPILAKLVADQWYTLGTAIPIRNEEAEKKLSADFSRAYALPLGKSLFLPAAKAVEFLEELQRKQAELAGPGEKSFQRSAPLLAQLPQGALPLQDFTVEFVSTGPQGEKRFADPQRVLAAWEQGESLVPLLDGGWADIPRDWLSRYGAKLRDLLEARQGGQGSAPACLYPLALELYEGLEESLPVELKAWQQQLVNGVAALPPVPLPADLSAELRPYQRFGVEWLSWLRQAGMGALLADDMGLGKTLQAIAVMAKPTLVVAPTSVLHNWAAELAKFRPHTRFQIYHGPQRQLDPEASVVLTTYAIMRLDCERLAQRYFDTLILDEAQMIKNPKSQVAQAAYQLQANFRIALSGTPVENKLEDLWSLFHFLNRGLLGSAEYFQKYYARPLLEGHAEAAGRLRQRVKPFILRRFKTEVAKELPARSDLVKHCELTPDERLVYESLLLASRKEVLAKLMQGGQVMQALEVLLRLRQAACHRALIPGEDKVDGSSKLSMLMEALQRCVENGHKALVFSQWTRFLDLMEPELSGAGLRFLRIDGSSKNRQDIVMSFQNEPQISVLLLSLKAAGVGLNLTAADHVFITDPWWNPAVEDQAADRSYRIGQDKPVFVTKLVAKDTVEEKILLLQEKKRSLADAVLSSKQAQLSLTREDLIELLQ